MYRIVVYDEKWIVYDNLRRKRSWKQAYEYTEAIASAGLYSVKVLLQLWWNFKGIIDVELLPASKTISCKEILRPTHQSHQVVIQEKRPILLNWKYVTFRHNK